MLEIIDKLREYFQYSFVIYALIAGVMIALSSSLLGVNLVLKRFSFIGDGLSHTAFGALSIATVLKITNTMYFVLPVTVVFAIILLCTKENSKIKGDTAVGMISVGALALGYLMLNKFSPKKMNISGDVCTTLFGSTSILTLSPGEVILSVVLSVTVVLIYIIFHNKIFAITFDENFAKAGGTNTNFFNILMAIVVAVVVVLSMNLVGTLLITALIIFPAVSALMLFKTFKSVMLTSSIFSVICAASGILIAIVCGTPVGATIVLADMILFFIVTVISKIGKVKAFMLALTTSIILFSSCEDENKKLDQVTEEALNNISNSTALPVSNKKSQNNGVLDFTDMNYNIAYAKIFNILINVEQYIGRTIKFRGNFYSSEEEILNDRSYSVLLYDATACCQTGFQFILTGEHKYPDDYPEEMSVIEIEGTLKMKEINGFEYLYIETDSYKKI